MVFDVKGDILFISLHGIARFDPMGTHLGTFFKWTGEGFNDGRLEVRLGNLWQTMFGVMGVKVPAKSQGGETDGVIKEIV